MKVDKKIPDGWVKMKSRNRPDREYYFNSKLNLSVWNLEDIKNQPSSTSKATLPSTSKSPEKRSNGTSNQSRVIKKNIAKDRMKNLQKNLRHEVEKNREIPKPKVDLLNQIVARVKEDNKKNVASDRMKSLKQQLDDELKNEEIAQNNDVELMDVSFEEVPADDHEEMEPMEWEQIPEEKIFEEIEKIRNDNVVSGLQLDVKKYDVGGKNPVEFYLVVDTNILISNLDYVMEIKGKMFKDLGKATIYLPYMVLDELDKLKSRESVAINARRANSFIDKCLTSKDAFLTGESRLEQEKLIPINSPDDEILNCCLKIKKMSRKIILLSNDKNLRNKSNLNHVTAFSSDMLKDARYSIELH